MTLFAYGTLLAPEIWFAVAGRDCPSEEAVLPGYEIRRVKGGDYPGIIRAGDEDEVPGRVFSGLDSEILGRLDAYEDGFYERIEVTLLDRRGNPVESETYVIPEKHREILSNETWSLDWFRERAMAEYMARLFSSR